MMRTSMRPHRGQAMIETLVACALVLVPLFLAIPMIAKYLDIRSHVVQAARYAAWERTVWFGGSAAKAMGLGSSSATSNKWDANDKTDTAIRKEIGARILSNTDGTNGFSSTDKSGSSYINGPKQLWQDRQGNTLLTSYGNITTTYANDKAPGIFNDLFDPVVQITSVVSNFTVDTNAQYTANVGLSVQKVAFNTDTGGLAGCPGCPVEFLATGTTQSFAEKNVLVANGWSANGPGSLDDYGKHPEKITVYNQIRGLTPTSLINPPSGAFRVALDVLKAVALVFFPELSTLDLGRIEVDRVPDDRLE